MTMTREELEKLSVEELRKLARKHTPIPGLRIAGMRKASLVCALLGEEIPTNSEGAHTKGNGNGNDLDLASILAEALKGKVQADGLDETRVKEIIEEVWDDNVKRALPRLKEMLDNGKQEIVVTIPDVSSQDVGVQHYLFETIVKLVTARLDVFLVGPSGGGKTYCCEQVAKALSLPFYMVAVGLQTTKSDLLGYMDASGNYVPSMLRRAYETGGVFLMDEIDAGNPNVLTVINAMLANDVAAFPDNMVKRHKDFMFIAAGNTYGKGADRQYVGRNQIDAATLDRMVVLNFDYDEQLEVAISTNKAWTRKVQKIRKITENSKERVIVSPRVSIKGAIMLQLGMSEQEIKDALIYKGVSTEVKQRIEAALQ